MRRRAFRNDVYLCKWAGNIYCTEEKTIPVGTSGVSTEFRGTCALNPAQRISFVSVTLIKQDLSANGIKSVALKEFIYDGILYIEWSTSRKDGIAYMPNYDVIK